MAKRDKLEVRLGTIKSFYEMYTGGLLGSTPEENLERAVVNAEFVRKNNGIFLFESELLKFYEKNPDVNPEDFQQYLDKTGFMKSSKKERTGTSGSSTRLNTVEGAEERSVSSENVEEYIRLVNQIYDISKQLNSLMTGARVSFAIPRLKAKPEVQVTE